MRGWRFLVSATTHWDRAAFDDPSFVVFVNFVVPYLRIWGPTPRHTLTVASPSGGWGAISVRAAPGPTSPHLR
jgi:hypothetical protein